MLYYLVFKCLNPFKFYVVLLYHLFSVHSLFLNKTSSALNLNNHGSDSKHFLWPPEQRLRPLFIGRLRPLRRLPIFNFTSQPPFLASETSAFANARIDWKETPEAHIFKADLPGIKKEEVKVEVEDGRVLQISGERSKEQEEKNDKWHRIEQSSGKFLRRFKLPENAKVEEVKANMENGVLTVTVPKMEKKKPEMKSIDISG